jgi:3'-5' exoribonuclease
MQADAPPPAPEETIRKVYVKDLRDKTHLHTVFRVSKKARITAHSGKVFLALSLADKSGTVEARVFDQVDEAEAAFAAGDFLLVEGNVTVFRGKLQVVLHKLQRLDPEPIDPAEFEPPPQVSEAAAAPHPEGSEKPASGAAEPGRHAVQQIHELVERVQDPHVKALLQAFLADPEVARALPVAPAAKGIHHAYRGGLAEHILSVMKLAHRMADHYPMADRDLLVAGALLHDIDKVRELSVEKGFEYTDEGRLVGHIVMTAQRIHEKAAQLPGFPKALEHHLTHLVLAHHGHLEYGSPKLPMTLEAHIVHAIDDLDSRIASWLELMARDNNERWTETSKLYERHLWKGPAPTVRGKSPLEGRTERVTERRERRRRGGQKPEGKPQAHREGHAVKEAPLAMSFKPLDALTPRAPESETPSESPPNKSL